MRSFSDRLEGRERRGDEQDQDAAARDFGALWVEVSAAEGALSGQLLRLERELELDGSEMAVLVLLLAGGVDPGLGVGLRALSGGGSLELGVALDVIGVVGAGRTVCVHRLSDPAHALQRWGLLEVSQAAHPDHCMTRLAPRLMFHLLGVGASSLQLERGVRCLPWPASLDALCVARACRERVEALRQPATTGPALVWIEGAGELEPGALGEALASDHSPSGAVVSVDARELVEARDPRLALRGAWREIFLEDAALCITHAEALFASDASPLARRALQRRLADAERSVVLCACAPPPRGLLAALPRLQCVRLQMPQLATRLAFWQQINTDVTLPDLRYMETTLATYPLGPLSIRALHTRLRSELRPVEDGAGHAVRAADLDRCARELAPPALDGLARRVTLCFTRDQLTLTDACADGLDRLLARLAQTPEQLASYLGPNAERAYGRAVVAMFKGPPGTGKTMAAAVVARSAGRQLFQVDLSQVVSKYIGDTGKHLVSLFEQARDADAALLFDEADALFRQRSSGNDAGSQHGSQVVAQLLQSIEAFEGLVILTTNNPEALDQAFGRRTPFKIDFPVPDQEARVRFFASQLQETFFTAHADELEDCAAEFELSGGHIKNALEHAASAAIMLGLPALTTELVWEACAEEWRQLGHLVQRH